MNVIDITGQKFGRLTVVARHGSNTHGAAQWACSCSCGKEAIIIDGRDLRKGITKSCGCLRKDLAAQMVSQVDFRQKAKMASTKHGMFGTPEHAAYFAAKDRCTNSKASNWSGYGGRGIKFLFT